ncbi:MAG: diguanylate cyclase domain-containing protein [Burkholderiaceae bacterium]
MTRTNADGSTHSLDYLYAEQVKLLYKNAPLAYVVTVINGAILIYIQSPYISRPILFIWYGSLLLVTAARAFVSFRYAKMNCRPEDAKFWNKIYLIGTGLAGCVWGSSALLLFPMNSMAHQVFVAFVLAGMSAGSISVLASRIEIALAFLLPTLLPLFFQYITLRSPLQTAMGVMTLLFFIGTMFSATNFHRAIKSSLNLRFDKQELEAEITKRNQVEESLYQEKDRLQATLSSIGEGVVMIDAEGRINYMNSAAEQLSGWGHHAALNRLASEVFESVDNQNQRTTTAMEDSLRTARQVRKQCVLLCNADRYIVEELATPLYGRHSNAVGAVSVFRDVTEAQQKTDELAYAADHDALTGLPNRNLLNDRTRQAIARAQRKHENFALLFLDLDRFKEVNDRMGHASGDALLIDVAKRLSDCVREEDTIARLGGDEFVVLLDGPAQITQVKAVADKILKALRKPYQLSKQSINVTVSIGSSLYPSDGQSVESLLEHADTAMYRAKKQGRDRLNMNVA